MSKLFNKKTLLRVLLPLLVIFVWLSLSGVGGPYFGKIEEVSSNDLATFLPKSAESTKVNSELGKFLSDNTIPIMVVFESQNSLTQDHKAQVLKASEAIRDTGHVKGQMSPPITSEDSKAMFVVVPLDSNSEFVEVIGEIKSAVEGSKVNLSYKFTGPAMFARDLNKAFAGIDGTLLLVALAVVFVILLLVYRSPFLPIITLASAMMALSTAILVVWHLAKADLIQLNGQVQGILFILVIGAATDYALLYISRYREELAASTDRWSATKAAWKGSWEPIVAAGGTVTLGLLCLLASDLGSNKALGPVGGIGVAFSILSALTFLPAALLIMGRLAFWPRKPKYNAAANHSDYKTTHKTWNRIGELVQRHPRRLWVGFASVLLMACLFVPQLKAQGVPQSDLIRGYSEAREGQALLDKHFPGGSGSPAYILTQSNNLNLAANVIEKTDGVDTIGVASNNPQLSVIPMGAAAKKFEQAAQAGMVSNLLRDVRPKEVGGKVLIEATLKDPADSIKARETVSRLRERLKDNRIEAQVGGVSAVQLDTNTESKKDLKVIIPLILAAITLVLMILLRSLVAPLVLLLTTILSFGATLGIAALLFNNVWHFAGADPSVITFGFVFLVALGIDYNIFLMTRVREETIKSGVEKGTVKALVVTGGVITSAGIVLASTFAALYVIPILFLAQVAFIVSFGVLLDTIIVRSLLVPGLTLDIGRKMWWPAKLGRNKQA